GKAAAGAPAAARACRHQAGPPPARAEHEEWVRQKAPEIRPCRIDLAAMAFLASRVDRQILVIDPSSPPRAPTHEQEQCHLLDGDDDRRVLQRAWIPATA